MGMNFQLRKSYFIIILILLSLNALWAQFPQGFEGGVMPTGWTVYNVDGDTKQFAVYNAGAASAQEGTWVSQVGYNASGNNDWLVTPQVNVTESNKVVKFWARSTSSTFFEDFNLKLSTTGIAVEDFTVNLGTYLQIPNAWTEYTADLTPYVGTTVYLALQVVSVDELNFRTDAFDWVLGNDLQALSIIGSTSPTAGTTTPYTIHIRNNGANTQNNYSVKLYVNDVEIASQNGPSITAGSIVPVVIDWTPASAQVDTLYGKVVLDVDNNPANDQTPNLVVNVQPAGTVVNYLGNPASTTSANHSPLNLYYKNSVVQTIYTADQFTAGGLITSLKYFGTLSAATNGIPGPKPVKVWLANTTQSSFATTSSWIPYADFTLVFDGIIDFSPEGAFELNIPFNGGFVYTGGNLAIMFHRPMDTVYHSSSNVWKNTATADARTLYIYSDSVVHDPMALTAGTTVSFAPNVSVSFNTAGLGSLNGVVTSNGNPVEGARVTVQETQGFAMTNAQGQYNFQYISAGTVTLVTTKHGYIDQTTPNVSITADQATTQNIAITQLPTVTVSGQIIASNTSAGLANATVALEGYENYTTLTNMTGNFSISGVYSGHAYTVRVTKAGYQETTQQINVENTDFVVPNITLEANPPIINVLVGNPESTLRTVKLPANFNFKNSLTQCIYMASELNALYPLAPGNSITAIKYYVAPTGVIPADRPLKIWMANTTLSTFASTTSWISADQFTLVFDGLVDLSSTETTELNITLSSPFEYSGQNVVIMVQRPLDTEFYQNTNLWQITETTAFPNRSINRQHDTEVITPEAPGTGELSARVPNTMFTINTAGLANVSGVVSSNGNPIQNALVTVEGANRTAITNAEGYYEITNLFPGSFTLITSCIGYETLTEQNVVLIEGQTTTHNISLTALALSSISGQINTSNGTGIWDATVRLTGYATFETNTNDTGAFVINNVYLGQTYTITVTKSGYLSYSDTFTYNTANLVLNPIVLNLSPVFFNEDFEGTAFPPAGWSIVDADGDNNNWYIASAANDGHESAKCAASASYTTTVLTPDNYLITPQLSLQPNETYTLKFWVAAFLPAYVQEHYSVMVSTSNPLPSNFVAIHTETISSAAYQQKSISLDDYLGENVYIAFRHHNSTDIDRMRIDDVMIERAAANDPNLPQLPKKTALKNNYPNPFNPSTSIAFDLSQPENVCIDIYNVKGQKVKTLTNQFYQAGSHSVMWNGQDDNNQNVSSGIYFFNMRSGKYTSTRKMILLK